jgi:hypothetical protein
VSAGSISLWERVTPVWTGGQIHLM